MKKLLCLMGGAMLALHAQAQNKKPDIFHVGDRIPNLPLMTMTNYKADSAWLSSFGDRLVILDFWNIHCTACLQQFPIEDSLQKLYADKIQFLLITIDPKVKVDAFLKKYKIQHPNFSLPILCQDSTIWYLFRHSGIPSYAFIAPNGQLLVQGTSYLMQPEFIEKVADKAIRLQKKMKRLRMPESVTNFEKPSEELLRFIETNKFSY